ncbi:phosphatase PAP2 family protein [Flagellimonas meridianipacifica]|uniref:Undecaprenyl-diphosphatase n=1 Tax=Flagellimonas meridianipacifica TaxID=1080225 RepID=A0A2T0M6J4_9FLAO|nr:phosphatase PAP2 family protein [Allomuricauda pacifica]PRX53052.1 undecaprenyl-diphosphatase [Allomuricauda pacifica]
MLDQMLSWDKQALLYLNNLGSPTFDSFWSLVTHITSWIPLFILFIILFLIKYPIKQALQKIGLLVLLIFAITGLCNYVKTIVGRLRPCNDETINGMMRILHTPSDFSFFSGHASSSFAVTFLVFLLLREKVKWAGIFFVWPILFSYSRLYLGVHFPLDIIVGTMVGVALAWFFFKGYNLLFHPAQGQSISNGQ